MSGKAIHIGLFGTFDLKNYGDLIFPDVFRSEIGKRIPGCRVTLFSPLGGTKPFTREDIVFPIRELGRIHEEDPFSALVVGGGDIVRLDDAFVADAAKYSIAGRTSQIWLVPILFGRLWQIPVFFNAPGVPFEFSAECRPLVTSLLSLVRNPNVRDAASRELLRFAKPEVRVDVAPDTVCLYGETLAPGAAEKTFAEIAEREKIPERFALFQSSGLEPGLSDADCAARLLDLSSLSDCPVVLLPIGYVHSDENVLRRVAAASEGRLSIMGTELSPMEMFSVIGHAQWFVGTSMHGCLTAMQQGVPAIALKVGSVTKMDGLLSEYGMSGNLVARLADIDPDMLSRRVPPESADAIRRRAREHFDRLASGILAPAPKECRERDGDLLVQLSSFVRDCSPHKDSARVYFDRGNGFSETDIRPLRVVRSGESLLIDEAIELPPECRGIRIDPDEGTPLRVVDASIRTEGGKEISAVPANGVETEDGVVFPTPDPQFLSEPPDGSSRLFIRIRFSRATATDIGKSFERIALRLAEAERIALEARQGTNSELERLRALETSLSWRITKPLRRMADVFRTIASAAVHRSK